MAGVWDRLIFIVVVLVILALFWYAVSLMYNAIDVSETSPIPVLD